MATRRDALTIATGAAACGFGLLAPSPARADRVVPLADLSERTFHSYENKLFAQTRRFAVPSYRFGVVVSNGMGASSSGSSVNVDSKVYMTGLDAADLSAIADLCIQDFIAQMTATGRTHVPNTELAKTAAGQQLEPTPEPFVKKPFADSRTVALVSPSNMALYNLSSDSPLTDKGAFDQGNSKAMGRMSAEADCLVLIPSLVLDFAMLSGSGHSNFGGGANVNVKPGLFLPPLLCQLTTFRWKDPRFGPSGKMILEQQVALNRQAGELVQTASHNNNAEVAWWNSTARYQDDYNVGPTQSYNYSSYRYQVDRQMFARAALDAASALHRIYTGVARTNAPA
jgi:hypothetical protein